MKHLLCVLICVGLVGCVEVPDKPTSKKVAEAEQHVDPAEYGLPDIMHYKARHRERVRLYWQIETEKQKAIDAITYSGKHADIAGYIQVQVMLLEGL